ncbi:MAG: hypothetical protein H8E49_13345 [Gammaproteobacteria bacterium]|nr:hypothetical protein [Gammaproteobacteria bacterium]
MTNNTEQHPNDKEQASNFDENIDDRALDSHIRAALQRESNLTFTRQVKAIVAEVSETFRGQHQFFLLGAVGKWIGAILLLIFAVYQFFQQESMMGLIAYASLTIICVLTEIAIFLTFWITIHSNNRQHEIKQLELQVALLNDRLRDLPNGKANNG